MKRVDIIIDIETLDTAVTAKIIGIGAVAMVDGLLPTEAMSGVGELEATVTEQDRFHRTISATEDRLNYERTISVDTANWWLEQESKLQSFYGVDDLKRCGSGEQALYEFASWIHDQPQLHTEATVYVWGNGSVFDISILEHAYKQLEMPIPWKFWNIRDVRTLLDMAEINKKEVPFAGIPHYALDDARHEAKLVELAMSRF